MEKEEVIVDGAQDGTQVFLQSFTEATGEKAAEKPAEKPAEKSAEEPVKPAEAAPGTAPVVEKKDEKLPAATPSDDNVNYRELYEKEVQRTKSWEGRISAADKRVKELEEKIKTSEPVPGSSPAVSTDSKLVDVNDPLIKGFIDEMGQDFIKPLEAYMRKVVKEQFEPLMAQFKPLLEKVPTIEKKIETTEKEAEVQHYNAILEAHADAADIVKSGDLEKYVKTLPYDEAVEKQKIMKNGTAKQVIELITDFKEKTGKVKPKTDPSPKPSSEKVAEATAVKGGSYVLPKGKPDANDFVGAFNQALAEKQ